MNSKPIDVERIGGGKAKNAESASFVSDTARKNGTPAADRAKHLARRKELYEAIHPETKQGGVRTAKQNPESGSCSFVDDTARKTGKARSTVAQDVQIGTNLAPDQRWCRFLCSRCSYRREAPGVPTGDDLDRPCFNCGSPLRAVTVFRVGGGERPRPIPPLLDQGRRQSPPLPDHRDSQ